MIGEFPPSLTVRARRVSDGWAPPSLTVRSPEGERRVGSPVAHAPGSDGI